MLYIHTYHIDFEALVLALEERLLILVLAHMLERRTFLGTDRNAHPLYRQDKLNKLKLERKNEKRNTDV